MKSSATDYATAWHTITPQDIGAATSGDLDNVFGIAMDALPKAGGTMTGDLVVNDDTASITSQPGKKLRINADTGQSIRLTLAGSTKFRVDDAFASALVPLTLPANPVNANEASNKQYVDTGDATTAATERSKGGGLIVNGTGYLGNNTNFSQATFVTTDHPVGAAGSFLFPTAANFILSPDEFLPIDANAYYYVGGWLRETNPAVGSPGAYMGFAPYDVDGLSIGAQHTMYVANTLTTLAAPLNPGDLTVTLTSASGWQISNAASYNRSMIVWNYVDGTGYAWPPQTYSRNWYTDLWADGGITGNVITLRVPWAGPALPAGTSVSNGSSGGTYMYTAWNNSPTTTAWAFRDNAAALIGGGPKTTGAAPSTQFPYGTTKAKLVILGNRVASGRTAAAGVTVMQMSPNAGLAVQRPGDTMTGPLVIKVNGLNLTVTGGGTGTSPAQQILFGYQGLLNYCHAIYTGHDASSTAGNKMRFYLWKLGDVNTAPTNLVLALNGDNVTSTYQVRVRAGNATATPGVQLALSYLNTDNYSHTISSAHHFSNLADNFVLFKVWTPVDAVGVQASVSILKLAGDYITAYKPVVLPADPVQLLEAATKQYVDNGDALKAPLRQTIWSNSATGINVQASYEGLFVLLTAATAVTINVPTNASTPLPVGYRVDFVQMGAGKATVLPAGGVTVNSTPTLSTRAQYSAVSLIKTGTDTWVLVGDLG